MVQIPSPQPKKSLAPPVRGIFCFHRGEGIFKLQSYETDERSSWGETTKRRRGRIKRRLFRRSGLNFQGGFALRRKFRAPQEGEQTRSVCERIRPRPGDEGGRISWRSSLNFQEGSALRRKFRAPQEGKQMQSICERPKVVGEKLIII